MSYVMTAEHKAKLSVAHKGLPTWNKGIPMTDEQRAVNSASHMGLVMPETTRLAIHKANLGSHRSEEIKAKMCVAQANVSLETRAKNSAAHMGHIVSLETCAKLSASNKGKHAGFLNPHWKGGITPINKVIRHGDEYIAWRTAVFTRDDYTCQECGRHGGDLEAHHIHEFAEYLDERFVVENGKTLCLECHNKTKRKKIKEAA